MSERSPLDNPPSPPITLGVIGCGERGRAYANYALKQPTDCQVVAIAEPRPATRRLFAEQHASTLHPGYIFEKWEDFVTATTAKGERLCDAVVVAVWDSLHAPVVMALTKLGYHILCEKPMATSVNDCFAIHDAVVEAGIIFGMGHVMRYSPYSKAITAIIDSGRLGELVNIVQVEPVGYYHFAHSYVRGNWHSEADSSFSLMTKCCHDIDILCRWLLPAKPVRVSSFGSLTHFRKSGKPEKAGSAVKCLECRVQDECPYSAKTIYLDPVKRGHKSWPVSPLVDGIPDIENVTAALTQGPYGRCVYESPNDVADHQVVNIEYSTGATVSFTMVAFTETACQRQARLHFTHGEIIGDMTSFTVNDFRSASRGIPRQETHHPPLEGGGHGGGDVGLIKSFVDAVRGKEQKILGTDIREILQSHLTVFASEDARKGKTVVDCELYEEEKRAAYTGDIKS